MDEKSVDLKILLDVKDGEKFYWSEKFCLFRNKLFAFAFIKCNDNSFKVFRFYIEDFQVKKEQEVGTFEYKGDINQVSIAQISHKLCLFTVDLF